MFSQAPCPDPSAFSFEIPPYHDEYCLDKLPDAFDDNKYVLSVFDHALTVATRVHNTIASCSAHGMNVSKNGCAYSDKCGVPLKLPDNWTLDEFLSCPPRLFEVIVMEGGTGVLAHDQ